MFPVRYELDFSISLYCDCKVSVATKKKRLVVSLKRLGAKMN
jgi:hypothetical protein